MSLAAQLARIASSLQPKIDDALNNEVAQAVKAEEAATIDAEVYGVYSPSEYSRRQSSGGLSDAGNMLHTVSDGKLTVSNNAPANPVGRGSVTTGKDLASVVEHGYSGRGSYDFPKAGEAYMSPRPFTAETKRNLEADKAHVQAMRAGLQRQGVNVQ